MAAEVAGGSVLFLSKESRMGTNAGCVLILLSCGVNACIHWPFFEQGKESYYEFQEFFMSLTVMASAFFLLAYKGENGNWN